MKWNFTKSILLFALAAGAVTALANGVSSGKWENGIGTAIWVAVLGGVVALIADITSHLRGRGSAGRQAGSGR